MVKDDKERTVARTRRALVKALISLSAVLAFASFLPIGSFLSSQKRTVKLERKRVANIADIPSGASLIFTYPTEDRPAILIHLKAGSYPIGNYWEKTQTTKLETGMFTAYDNTCTHLGCPVGWIEEEMKMGPSCHGARFSPVDGTVLQGPPPRPMPKIRLEIESNGDIYANGYEGGLPLYGWEGVKLV